jgi:hypothetical protein
METMPCQRKRQYRITTPDSSGALNPTTEWIASHLSLQIPLLKVCTEQKIKIKSMLCTVKRMPFE